MPNWKMRANRLVDGSPTISPCKDAELWIDLHDTDEPDDRVCGHEAVGIERDRELVTVPPAFAEISDVAGLEAAVHGTLPVADGDPIAPRCDQFREERLFPDCKPGIVGVAQEVEMEALCVSGRAQTFKHRLEVTDGTHRQFVANAKQDRRRRCHRIIVADQSDGRQHGGDLVGGKAHDDTANQGIAEAGDHPG